PKRGQPVGTAGGAGGAVGPRAAATYGRNGRCCAPDRSFLPAPPVAFPASPRDACHKLTQQRLRERIWFHLSRGTPPLCSFRRQSGTCPTLERSGTMKHLFAIAVLLLAVCGRVFGGPASDERELTKLVKDFNRVVLKADIDFLERLLHKDYVHHNQRG